MLENQLNYSLIGKTILVVDDEITIISILKVLLSEYGARILTASNGIEAIELLKKQEVDYVITDYKMPQMDGLGLIQWIRKNYSLQMSVILLTGSVSCGLEHKVDDCTTVIYKPFEINKILEIFDTENMKAVI